MKKQIIFLLLFISQIFFSQIKMELNILKEKSITTNEKEYLLEIKLINESNVDYIIPIDTTGYNVFSEKNQCHKFLMQKSYPDLGIRLRIKDSKTGSLEIPFPILVDYPLNHLKTIVKKLKKERKQQKQKIKKWKQKQRLNGTYEEQNINWYLYHQLKILNSKSTIVYKKKINPSRFNEDKHLLDVSFFDLQEDKDYNLFLEFCIDKGKYNYLTPQQKEQYKDYKFFTGKIISNEVEL